MSPYILRTFSAMLLPNLKMKFYVFQDGYIIIYKVLYIYTYIHTAKGHDVYHEYVNSSNVSKYHTRWIQMKNPCLQTSPHQPNQCWLLWKKWDERLPPPPAGPTSADDSLLQPLHSSKLSWPGSPKGLVPRLSGVFQDVKCFLWKCFHLLLLLYDV